MKKKIIHLKNRLRVRFHGPIFIDDMYNSGITLKWTQIITNYAGIFICLKQSKQTARIYVECIGSEFPEGWFCSDNVEQIVSLIMFEGQKTFNGSLTFKFSSGKLYNIKFICLRA